jgi:hypothetical protein
MNKNSSYILVVPLVFLFQQVNAQEKTDSTLVKPIKETYPLAKHSIHAEVGGRSFIVGSLNYEYAMNKRFSFGTGVGFINLNQGSITRINNNIEETGKFRDLATTQMIYGNYFVGRNKHQLLITAGLTNFLFSYKSKYPSVVLRSTNAQLEWNAGIGYQYTANKMFFRLTAYCISLPDPSGWFPKYMPWVGIIIGRKLR